jgi:hypothetical protein
VSPLFGRRRRDEDAEVPADAARDETTETDEESEPEPEPEADPRANGPWDEAEVGHDEGYVDLGALKLRGREGMELRLEVDEASGRVTAATVQIGPSAVHLQAFAAPRSAGIWDEIRSEIHASISKQGGSVDDVPGVFGRELLARIPVRRPDGRTEQQATRFTGIDGPRWFLRAVFHGNAAFKQDEARVLEDVVREIVVIRGKEPMAPRELLLLSLPESTPAPAEDAEPDSGASGNLSPFERGPEITEIR